MSLLQIALEELAHHTNVVLSVVRALESTTLSTPLREEKAHVGVADEALESDDDETGLFDDEDESDDDDEDGDDDDDSDVDEMMQWVLNDVETTQLFQMCRQTLLMCGNMPFEVIDGLLRVCALLWNVPQARRQEIPSKTVDVQLAFQLLSYVTQQDVLRMQSEPTTTMGMITVTPFADAMATCIFFLQHAMPNRENFMSLDEARALHAILQHVTLRAAGNARVAMFTMSVLQFLKHLTVEVAAQQHEPLLLQPEWVTILARLASTSASNASPDQVRNWGPTDNAWSLVHYWTDKVPNIVATKPNWIQLSFAEMEATCAWLQTARAMELTQSSNNIFMLEARLWTLRVARNLIQGPLSDDLPDEHPSSQLFNEYTRNGRLFSPLIQALLAASRLEDELTAVIACQSSSLSLTALACQSRARRVLPSVAIFQSSLLDLLMELILSSDRTSIAAHVPPAMLAALNSYVAGLFQVALHMYENQVHIQSQSSSSNSPMVSVAGGTAAAASAAAASSIESSSVDGSASSASTSFNSALSTDVTSRRVVEQAVFCKLAGVIDVLEALLYAPFSLVWWQEALQSPLWTQLTQFGQLILGASESLKQSPPRALVNLFRTLYQTLRQAYPPCQDSILRTCHSYLLQSPETDNSDSDSEEEEDEDEDEELDSSDEDDDDENEDDEDENANKAVADKAVAGATSGAHSTESAME